MTITLMNLLAQLFIASGGWHYVSSDDRYTTIRQTTTTCTATQCTDPS